MSNALNLMLLSTGIPTTEILNICAGQPATDEQQRLLYAAFTLIVQKDLEEILIPLNCQTKGLFTLADLLDPKKLFPNSYQTLTFPIYNSDTTGPTNSKTYYLIYKDDAPANIDTYDLGARLRAYLPNDLAFVCAAFRITMMQIKNIHSMDIEKFSQVVTHLEPISDLNVGGTNVPTDITTANIAKSYVAMGTNNDGTYSMCDFFGCITSLHYDWITIRELILATESPALSSIYQQMFYLLDGDGPFNTQLQTLINNANAELSFILANSETATELNTLYAEFGHYLDREQTAREGVLRDTANLKGNVNDIIGFLQNIGTYAQSTEEKGPALVLEDIADLNTLGGNSLIASMREARNALKLGLTGAMLENIVNNDALVLPPITGTMSSLGLPIVTGAPTVPGSLAGSPETTLIPPNLSIFNTPSNTKAVIFPDAAVSQVITCNCDCWLP
jgi:hypothetical protein